MKHLLTLAIILFCGTALLAQSKPAVKPAAVQPAPVTPPKPVPMVSTKELKKQLEKNFKRKRYKAVLPIADTLLKRNKKDENVFYKKLGAEIFLKMDKAAIADMKAWYKNKDTAAMMISMIPIQFAFREKKRSGGELYFKTALALSPKSGLPQIFYASDLADGGKYQEALTYADKGYANLSPAYKKIFIGTYAEVLYIADQKERAYQFITEAVEGGNNSDDNVRSLFKFYRKDKRYEDGIRKATELIAKDSVGAYFSGRASLYNEMGNTEKACEDALTLRERFGEYDYWLKKYGCPQVMADVSPTNLRTYIYEVNFQDKIYDFRVSNPKVDMDNGISFKFKMTGDVGVNGTVSMSKEAVATAHEQMNMFNKENFELTDRTTVWISKEVFNELKTKGSSSITASAWTGALDFELMDDETTDEDNFYVVRVDDQDKYIKCFKVVAKNGDQELYINDDPNNPIILKMKVDFSIELKQVL